MWFGPPSGLAVSGEERWQEPLIAVEILGHMWVPDVDQVKLRLRLKCEGGGWRVEGEV